MVSADPESDQDPSFGVEQDAGRPGQCEGVDRRPGVEWEPDRGRLRGGPVHGRPLRVAVISWLRPPDRARRLTAENPASISMERSSAVGGR